MVPPLPTAPRAQRSEPSPASSVLLTTALPTMSMLGLGAGDVAGAAGSSAQAPSAASVRASGQRPARDGKDCMAGSLVGRMRLRILRRVLPGIRATRARDGLPSFHCRALLAFRADRLPCAPSRRERRAPRGRSGRAALARTARYAACYGRPRDGLTTGAG